MYAIVHMRGRDIEAIFVEKDHEAAVRTATYYAGKAGFFDPEVADLDAVIASIEDDLHRTGEVESAPPMKDIIKVKRVFKI